MRLLTPTTLLHLITDLVDALERQGLRKLVLLNGHGGNELKPLMRELHHRTKVFLCLCDWFRMAQDRYACLFDKPGEHADEVLYVPETNWLIQPMLAIVPLQLLAYRIARARGLNVDDFAGCLSPSWARLSYGPPPANAPGTPTPSEARKVRTRAAERFTEVGVGGA